MQRSRVITRVRYAMLGALIAAAAVYAYTYATREIVRVPVEFIPEPESWGVPVGVPAPMEVASKPGHVEAVEKCRIPRFGLHPWRRTGEPMGKEWEAATRRALEMSQLPGPAIDQAITRLRNIEPDDIVLMSNTHGAGRGVTYYPTFTTTYRHKDSGGRAICWDSKTNFGSDTRTEAALVYRVQHAGKVYPVGIFLACNNVTVFNQAPPGWLPNAPRGDLAQWVVPHPAQAHGAPLPGHPGYLGVPGHGQAVNDVPEPGSIALFVLALGGLIGVRRWRAGR